MSMLRIRYRIHKFDHGFLVSGNERQEFFTEDRKPADPAKLEKLYIEARRFVKRKMKEQFEAFEETLILNS